MFIIDVLDFIFILLQKLSIVDFKIYFLSMKVNIKISGSIVNFHTIILAIYQKIEKMDFKKNIKREKKRSFVMGNPHCCILCLPLGKC